MASTYLLLNKYLGYQPSTKSRIIRLSLAPSSEGLHGVSWEFPNAQLSPCWLCLLSPYIQQNWVAVGYIPRRGVHFRLPRCQQMTTLTGGHLGCAGWCPLPLSVRRDSGLQTGISHLFCTWTQNTVLWLPPPHGPAGNPPRWVSCSSRKTQNFSSWLSMEGKPMVSAEAVEEGPALCWNHSDFPT